MARMQQRRGGAQRGAAQPSRVALLGAGLSAVGKQIAMYPVHDHTIVEEYVYHPIFRSS
jgi:hypothetical protein